MNTHCRSHTQYDFFVCNISSPYFMVYVLILVDPATTWLNISRVFKEKALDYRLHLSEQILPSGGSHPTPWTEDSTEQTTIHTHTPICLSPDTCLWTVGGSQSTRKHPWPEGDLNPGHLWLRGQTLHLFFPIQDHRGSWAEPGIPAQREHANHCPPEDHCSRLPSPESL